MRPPSKTWLFLIQSAVLGLALAFLVILVKPDLIYLPTSNAVAGSSLADAVAASSPAVVSIYTEGRLNTVDSGSAVPLRARGLGSGVVINDGYLLTNYHVIEGADEIRVRLSDGRVATPELVGTDPDTEVALLRIALPDLPSVELGRSDELRVGDFVLAIGNSLGLDQTVTMGIVSATGRDQLGLTIFENFIQTDAAINIGNSGGALVNQRGELVGINTAVVASARAQRAVPAGLGFAIPVNLVRGVMQELIEHGRVIRGYLGVEPEDLSRREAESLGLDRSAVLLRRVWGPAAQAGLAPGDVLTHIDGQRIETRQQALNIVASHKPGDELAIRVARVGDRVFDTLATLEERPPQ
jgi:serine protease DegS